MTTPGRSDCFLSLLLAASIAGCSQQSTPADGTASESRTTVTLFAAASTGPALEQIVDTFNRRNAFHVDTNFASSSTLAKQIVSGADADVFVSANEDWAEFLNEKGLVAKRMDLLSNRLVIVVPKQPPVEVEQPADLLNAEIHHLALAEPESVPAGIYARQALTKLGLWKQLAPKVVAAADVRQALAYVETGAAEAGIVYATDAASSNDVVVAAEIDPSLTDPIRYPVVVLKQTTHPAEASTLYDYLSTPPALDVFRQFGFTVLDAQPEATKEHTP